MGAYATFSAEAELRRGVNFDLGLEALAELDASLRRFLAGSLEADVHGTLRVRGQMQTPLNLFKESGAIVRLQAAAELAAGASLTLGLSVGDFLDLVKQDPAMQGLPYRLLEVFLEEVTIGAGVYGKAALSAMAYANLAGKTWDIVIDTAQQVSWTREAVAALKGSAGRFMYVSSTGVFLPYRTVDIPEDGPIVLQDTPPRDPPSYGVMKALSEIEARRGFPSRAVIVRPCYIVGPGDTTDRFTYWPVRVERGGEIPVTGRKGDFVQYMDVRDLARWMVQLVEDDAAGDFNAAGPAAKQTLEQFVEGLRPLAKSPLTYTWIEDYAWLRRYPLRKRSDGGFSGMTYSVPWVMAEGDELGHQRIDNRKAIAAGLTFRPLIETARDTIAWRASDAVPEELRKQPRYVLTPEQEQAMLAAWKARKSEA